jgi:hypothetical protein
MQYESDAKCEVCFQIAFRCSRALFFLFIGLNTDLSTLTSMISVSLTLFSVSPESSLEETESKSSEVLDPGLQINLIKSFTKLFCPLINLETIWVFPHSL